MNVQSILLLLLILLVAGIVLFRYVKRQRRTGGCASCHCEGCSQCSNKERQTAS